MTRPVQLYAYTDDGRLLACLIASFDQNKREQAYSEAYDVLQSMLSIEPASYEIFHCSLYKKYKARGVFGEFIMDRLRESLESISEITTLGELRYSSLIIFHTNDAAKGRLYLDLWNETFNEMSPIVQELLLFHMKMEIEQRMMHRAMAPQKYEKYRMESIHLSPVLTMEGYCRNCNLGYPLLMQILDHHEKTNFLPNDPIIVECPQCKNNSLHIPTL